MRGYDLKGECGVCGTNLTRALVRELRHYEETRLLQVTCGGCERQFLAIDVLRTPTGPMRIEDVAAASRRLALARKLTDLFDGDPSSPDAA